jgi:hypothetical protein
MGWRLLPPSWQVAWLKGTLLQAAYIFTRELAQQVSGFSRGFCLKDLSHDCDFFILFMSHHWIWITIVSDKGVQLIIITKCNSHTICFAFVLKTAWSMNSMKTCHLKFHYKFLFMQTFGLYLTMYLMKTLLKKCIFSLDKRTILWRTYFEW